MKFTAAITTICLALASVAEASPQVGIKHCNADGCLRALLPTRDVNRFASGAAFCVSFLLTPQTTVTGLPPQATKSCGTQVTRLSSACSCIPPAPTPTID